jgi:MYXO-CTERM domain-containing protein
VSRLRGLAALCTLLVSSPALAFLRSTTDSGLCLWWRPRQINYAVNTSALNSGCDSRAAAAGLARASVSTWMSAAQPGALQACTDFKFNDCGDTSRTDLGYNGNEVASNVNLIVFRSGLCSQKTDPLCTRPSLDSTGLPDFGPCIQKTNCWEHDASSGPGGTIALTTVTFDNNTGEILDADMELHGWNGSASAPDGFYFTCAGPGAPICSLAFGQQGCVAMDIGNTVTHEAGHMLGLDHPCALGAPPSACPVGGATMEPTAGLGDTDKRTLKPDDVLGVCTMYPAGGPTTTCLATIPVAVAAPAACPVLPSAGGGGGGCGCGTASASGLALLGLFLAALWPRRRSAQ